MKKKGFTLIELLAVIIILAVIALIATPIILNVVDNAKESARQSSISGYADATRLAVTEYQFGHDGQTPTLDQAFIDTIKPQGSTVTCENVIYSNDYGVVLNKCNIAPDNNEYCFASGKTYTDCTNQEFQDIYNKVNNGDVALVGNPIGDYAKALVYNGDSCKTDGTTYQYMNGCYLKGTQSTNYVWYSGFLWRIMGINEDGTVRLITAENVTAIPYNTSSSNFDGSHADKWLNEYFLSHLKGTDIIKPSLFCQGAAISDKTTVRPDCTGGTILTRKVGLLSIDEYNLANTWSSYLFIDQYFWTMSPYNSTNSWYGMSDGDTGGTGYNVYNALGLQAVVNIDYNAITTSGNGTLSSNWSESSSPYILNENKKEDITGKLSNKVSSGEYVKFGDKMYRVVSNNKGMIKLILDGYYQENGTIYEMSYGTDNTFSTISGIGEKLNTDVLKWLTNNNNNNLKDKILPSTWYQNNYAETAGGSYTISLEETNPTRKIENTQVGLIRVGELLSGQSYTILTKNGTLPSGYRNATAYWTMTAHGSNLNEWTVPSWCSANIYGVNNSVGLRPVIVISSASTIIRGNGTPSNPYEI